MGKLWRTNSAGMRGPEAAREPTPGTFRIALFGDSFVAGAGVAEEQTYAAQLERLLAESGGAARFEVLNFGQPGLNARTVAAHARDLGRYFRSSLYVYGVTLNDIFEPGEELVAAPPPPDPDAFASRHPGFDSRLWRTLRPHWLALRELFAPSVYTELLLRGYRDPEKLARLAQAVSELGVLGARDGACVHVFTHTGLSALRFGHRFGEVYDQIERTAREAGASASSSYPAFRGRDSTRLRLSARTVTPTRKAIASWLERSTTPCARCRPIATCRLCRPVGIPEGSLSLTRGPSGTEDRVGDF